jgi:hypothetical protein
VLSGLAVGLVVKAFDFKHNFSPLGYNFQKDLDKGLFLH